MQTALSKAVPALVLIAFAVVPGCGGGGDGGTPPITVATVTIAPPAVPINFGALGRTVQLTASAKDAGGVAVAGATITWSSSNTAAATVSGSGLVTAVANGTAQITASAGGKVSPAVSVTVAQVANAVAITPGAVNFGAIGKTRQLTAAVTDSTANPVAGATVTWTRAGPGTVASVSGAGLATALAVGSGDTAVATAGTLSAKAPITVTQVVASVAVTSTSTTPDTLFTSTRTRQFSAAAADSNGNAIASATFTWSSSVTGVATVNGAGLVTAGTTDGSTTIQASSGGINGTRALVLRRYPATFTITPPSASISTAGGTQLFTGTAQDSVGGAMTPSWTSKNTAVLTVSPASGSSTTATATGNGSTHVVIAAGTRRDSSAVTVTNQPTAPATAAVSVGDNFFRSGRNATQNPAIDTVAVGGTVTWTWTGAASHSVESTGNPTFTSSTIKNSGTYALMFNTAGTYTYDCAVHGSAMSGTVVVR